MVSDQEAFQKIVFFVESFTRGSRPVCSRVVGTWSARVSGHRSNPDPYINSYINSKHASTCSSSHSWEVPHDSTRIKVINPGQTPTYIKLYINIDVCTVTVTKSAACAQKLADKPMQSGHIHANE